RDAEPGEPPKWPGVDKLPTEAERRGFWAETLDITTPPGSRTGAVAMHEGCGLIKPLDGFIRGLSTSPTGAPVILSSNMIGVSEARTTETKLEYYSDA
ncbi:hypothetical protein, partial [Marinobacter nauticus]